MRNYVNLIGVIVRDVPTQNPVTGGFVSTKDDADSLQADLEAIYTPPNFEVAQTVYWMELNKNLVAQILTIGIPQGLLNLPALQTKSPEKTWNAKNPAFVVSKLVDGDTPAVPGVTIARRKSPAKSLKVSIALYLTLLYQTYLTNHLSGPAQEVLNEL